MSQVAPAGRILFGTDGIRGRANVAPMTPELALRLGQALAHTISVPGRRARIVIGKDTRISGYVFETALAAGVCSMGADVQLCGPLPTPGIAFVTASMRADAGVVISASHNPYTDNGIKIFGGDGYKLPDARELALEALLHDEEFPHARPEPSAIGRAIKIDDVRGRYIVFLKSIFPRERTLEGLRIVVDCAHGAAYRVAPAVLGELGAEVIAINNAPDGFNINDSCGAVHPEAMCQAVRQHKAHVGIALDGDADRVIIADEKGQLVDGDIIMAICAQWMVKRQELQKNTVVATVMSNLGLERALDGMGCQLLRTQVGDRYVVETMRAGGYNFGGEQSGHLVFLDFMTTGDGMLAALRLLAALLEAGRPLSEMRQIMNRYPQILVNVTVREKKPLAELASVRQVIEVVENRLGKEGRVLVRYSGTEPKVRVMVEGPDETMISGYADEIVQALSVACA